MLHLYPFNIQYSISSIHNHSISLLVLLVLLLLSACTTAQPSNTASVSSGGGLTAQGVVEDFFTDLGMALQDPNLAQEDRRSMWVERLSAYFAPNERAEQRVGLNDSLNSFARDRALLGADETLTIEVSLGKQEELQVIEQGDHALVLLPQAQISIQLARITTDGIVPYYEQPIDLGRLTGRADHSIPTIRIGNLWYLTEG